MKQSRTEPGAFESMTHEQQHELAEAAHAYLEATTGSFNSPRIQHTRQRLKNALRVSPRGSFLDRLYAPWPAAQADGDAG